MKFAANSMPCEASSPCTNASARSNGSRGKTRRAEAVLVA